MRLARHSLLQLHLAELVRVTGHAFGPCRIVHLSCGEGVACVRLNRSRSSLRGIDHTLSAHGGDDAAVHVSTLRNVSVRCVRHILPDLSLHPVIALVLEALLLGLLLLGLGHLDCLRLLHGIHHSLRAAAGASAAGRGTLSVQGPVSARHSAWRPSGAQVTVGG